MRFNASIAVIGMAGRFPGTNSVEQFWTNLLEGKDCVDFPPTDREYLGEAMKTAGGYLSCRLDEFDAGFFNVNPKACPLIDPQQRLFLEVVWESLENAGIRPSTLKGTRTGVFYGTFCNEYDTQVSGLESPKDALQDLLGTSRSGGPGRVSHFLEFQGPAVSVESTCVSGALAIHMACQSLRIGESNLALAGGVNIILKQPPLKYPPKLLSKRCKTFDEEADGFVPAEGCGVLVLKRYAEAVRDGNTILGIIRGSAAAQDGNGVTHGFGTPNPEAQASAIRTAMEVAGVEPEEISLVELHGTGVRIGDVAEVQSLIQVFESSADERDHPLILATTKTNIGHSSGASAALSLIKVMHCLQQRIVPRILHFQNINSELNIERLNAVIPVQNTPIQRKAGQPLLACLNSFGLTGATVHFIIEEPPETKSCSLTNSHNSADSLVNISAKTPEALDVILGKYEHFVENMDSSFENFVGSLNMGRDHFSHRISVIADSNEMFLQKLNNRDYFRGIAAESKLIFMFTPLEENFNLMGREIYESFPSFRRIFDEVSEDFNLKFQTSLKKTLWAEIGNNWHLNQIQSQLALFSVQQALYRLWTQTLGIQPDVVLGYGSGEFGAAVAAGVLTFADAFNLICRIWELIHNNMPPKAVMTVVSASSSTVQDFLQTFGTVPNFHIEIAAINAPTETIIRGPKDKITKFEDFCSFKGIKTKRLRTGHAFQSKEMVPILKEFKKEVTRIPMQTPNRKYVSSVSGNLMESKDDFSPNYWTNLLRNKIQFSKALGKLLQEKMVVRCKHFIEIGPDSSLLKMVTANAEVDKDLVLCPSLSNSAAGSHGSLTILESLAKLHVTWQGDINWASLETHPFKRIQLPNYPFQRKRYWI